MQRFAVTQEDEEFWWVSHDGVNLYCYPNEEDARAAALALANFATASGAAAMVLIVPSEKVAGVQIGCTRATRRYTGM